MFLELTLTATVIAVIQAQSYSQCTTSDVNSYECVNFNNWWTLDGKGSRISSTNTHLSCVRLYDQSWCRGNYRELKPGSPGHRNLQTIGFGDTGKSVSPCQSQSSLAFRNDKYKTCDQSDCSGVTGCVTIYQSQNFGGWYQCLSFRSTECVTLNDWWRQYGSRVMSTNTHGTCIRIYEGTSCQGNSKEVKPGSASHGNLDGINFAHKVRSVSSCARTVG